MAARNNFVCVIILYVGVRIHGLSQNHTPSPFQVKTGNNGYPCPLEKQCTCYCENMHMQSTRVDCSNRNLTTVPKRLPTNANYIDLSNNTIEQLGQLPFVSYPMLQGLNMSWNMIRFIYGTNCAPLVADLFLFCYERDFMLSLSEENQSGIIEAFNSTSRYLDDLLNIDNNFFDSMVNRIYPSELQLNKANVSDAEASFLDLHLSISDGFVKTKIYDKRDDFDFDIVNFPFLDGDVPRSASYGVYISQLIRFARVSSHVDDFNTRNKVLTAKLLRQGYRYHKLRKAFSKFYRRHFDIVSKYNVGLKTLLLQGLSEPEFYGDLVYKFRKIIGKIDFPYHFKKIIVRYKKIGYNINVMRQTACLVVNPIKVNSFAYLFNCTTVGRTSD